jgi:Tol biopolymer transport system component
MFVALPRIKPTLPPPQTYPVTHLHKSISQPALSPDGKMITFISGDDQVYVALTSSGEATQLTRSSDTNAYPRFSSDGSRILFHRTNAEDLWEVPALGGEARRVLAQARNGVWSPDGTRLAFSRVEGQKAESTALFVGDARGANPRQIASIEGVPNVFPVFAPDGRQVIYMEAYQALRSPRLQVASVDGASPPRTLVSEDLISQPPAVSSDGGWVYYSAVKDGIVNLWRVALSNGQPQQVTFSIGEDQSPALDPNGWLYYVGARHRARLHLVEESGTKPLADDTLVTEAVLSPDDLRVAFVRPQWSGTNLGEVMLLNLATGRVQHVDTPGLVKNLHWSLDGKRLGYSSRATGIFQAHISDLDTGRNTSLPPSGRGTAVVGFSPTGECLVAHWTSSWAGNAAVFDPASGKERSIAQGVSPIGFSSDGKWIGLQVVDLSAAAANMGSGDILLAPAEGGQPRPVFHGVAIFPFFAPNPSRIIFFSSLAPPQLRSIAVNDGLGGPPEPYASQVLLQAFTEFGPQALMDFDFVHQRALVSVNESDMDIVRRKANP